MSIKSGGMTFVIAFQLCSGLSVWCGRGVRSGKKRFFWGAGDERRCEDDRTPLLPPSAALLLGPEPAPDMNWDEPTKPVSPLGFGRSWPSGACLRPRCVSSSSESGKAFERVKRDSSGKPDVAPTCQHSGSDHFRHRVAQTYLATWPGQSRPRRKSSCPPSAWPLHRLLDPPSSWVC